MKMKNVEEKKLVNPVLDLPMKYRPLQKLLFIQKLGGAR